MPNIDPTKLLLIGAGELGTAFLERLSTLPSTHITLGVRSPDKYRQLASSKEVELTKLDISGSSSDLSHTFAEYDVVVSATGFGQDPESVMKLANEILDAGKLRGDRGLGRLWFFPWQWGVDYDVIGDGQGLMPLFGAQRDVRNLLRQKAQHCNVKWTVVSTGIFMSFLFEPFWGIVDQSKLSTAGKFTVRCLDSWEHAVTVTDVDDIARVLVRILAGDVQSDDRVVYVAGDTVQYKRLATLIEELTGKQVEREEWSVQYLQRELAKDPEDGIKKYRLVFARPGVWWDKEKTVNQQLGMSMLDAESYIRKTLC